MGARVVAARPLPLRLEVVAVDEADVFAAEGAAEAAAVVGRTAGLHTAPGAHARDGVGGDAVVVEFGDLLGGEQPPLGIFAGEIEQVDAGEDDEEAGKEGNSVDGGGGVEAAEEDEAGEESEGCECDVVQRVYAVR